MAYIDTVPHSAWRDLGKPQN